MSRVTLAEFDLACLSQPGNEWTDREGKRRDVRITSSRRMAFMRTPFCVRCGVEGTHLVLVAAQSGRAQTIELVDRWGVRLTIDHIDPKCRGGKSELSNLQVLCANCNALKGSKSQRAFVNHDAHQGFVWRCPPRL